MSRKLGSLLERLTQPFKLRFAQHEGRSLELTAVVVAAEADAEAAGCFAFCVGKQLNRGFVVFTGERGLFDDLAASPVHFEGRGSLRGGAI